MRILIIEDETPAADRLKKMILDFEPTADITSNLVSIASAVKWLKENPAPDLIFMDIHLSDGDSFEIFNEQEVTSPVVFVTAYDQYALDAFKVNSIDYLLKPVKKEDLSRALEKYKQRGSSNMQQMMDLLSK